MVVNRPPMVIGDNLGITSEVQAKLHRAVQLCHQALADVKEAFGAAEPDSDAECRCQEAIADLEGALDHLEWAPPREFSS